jgi:hypothetical protein
VSRASGRANGGPASHFLSATTAPLRLSAVRGHVRDTPAPGRVELAGERLEEYAPREWRAEAVMTRRVVPLPAEPGKTAEHGEQRRRLAATREDAMASDIHKEQQAVASSVEAPKRLAQRDYSATSPAH